MRNDRQKVIVEKFIQHGHTDQPVLDRDYPSCATILGLSIPQVDVT